ncbi:hypothetical protein RKE29_08280 [Streptomyces sp. B1866]|uniref:hypothetical protein n=1 Tax=Streptomyces sp. B1866 TaxID=3075431 RepID=UPI00288FEE0C|nr:hypothetical protein [Streptomyces sp. B1866]MDT3396638.1 hypothetical protein [Streptomyces sp. B1866]
MGSSPRNPRLGLLWTNGRLIELERNQPGGDVRPEGINDRGQVIGTEYPDWDGRVGVATRWDQGVPHPLGPFAEGGSCGVAINNLGQALVISRSVPPDPSRPDVFAPYDQMHLVPPRGGPAIRIRPPAGARSFSYDFGINDRGQILGDYATGSAGYYFFWDRGRTIDLSSLGNNSSWTSATGPNRRGQITGMATRRAFLWQHGKLTVLGPEGAYSRGRALNNRGDVVGYVSVSRDSRPYLWSDGRALELPVPGQVPATALDVNDRREVVGHSEFHGTTKPRAYLWRDGEPIDLGVPPGHDLSRAEFISERGDILGHADHEFSGSLSPRVPPLPERRIFHWTVD